MKYLTYGIPAALLWALLGGGCIVGIGGCKSHNDNLVLLQTLQQGKAQGHLNVGSNGMIGGKLVNGLELGPTGTTLTFDGNIDFRDAKFPDMPGPETNEPPVPPG